MKYDTLIYRSMIFVIIMSLILCDHRLKIKRIEGNTKPIVSDSAEFKKKKLW